jgi:hypothetical protein
VRHLNSRKFVKRFLLPESTSTPAGSSSGEFEAHETTIIEPQVEIEGKVKLNGSAEVPATEIPATEASATTAPTNEAPATETHATEMQPAAGGNEVVPKANETESEGEEEEAKEESVLSENGSWDR